MKCLPLFCTALAFAFAATSGCKKQDEENAGRTRGDPNQVVASVDGVTYLRKDMDKTIDTIMDANHVPLEQQEKMRPLAEQELITRFVKKTLLINEAKRLGITATDEDRQAMAERFDAILQERDGITLDQFFKNSPEGEEAARKDFDENSLLDKIIQEKVANTIEIPDADVDAFITQRQAQNAQIEEANKKRLEVQAAARAKLEDLKKQLDAGADFAELAMAHSGCPTSKDGGTLGTFSRGQMVKPFEDAAFSQEVGKVGDIVETPFGYHLILVTAKNPAVEATADTPATPETVAASHILMTVPAEKQPLPIPPADTVRNYLKGKKVEAGVEAFVEELKAKATIDAITSID